jgi:hypothetical protein
MDVADIDKDNMISAIDNAITEITDIAANTINSNCNNRNILSTIFHSDSSSHQHASSSSSLLLTTVATSTKSYDNKASVADRWNHFVNWLEHKLYNCDCHAERSKPFDIIIDGGNVGYYKQNYAGAPDHVDYHQIQTTLVALQTLGYTPLLILHSRHLSPRLVPAHDAKVVDYIHSWKAMDCVYATPKGFNDDWFWCFAAVKYRLQVVTNDEMRDHHFQLLAESKMSANYYYHCVRDLLLTCD